MQLTLRHVLESQWHCPFQDQWTPEDGEPLLDCRRGWGDDLSSMPGRAALAFRYRGYNDVLYWVRDTVFDLIGGEDPSKVSHGWPADDDPMEEFDAASSEDDNADDEDSAAPESAEDDAPVCGTYAQLRALAAPFPFHASTKAILGPHLLDTLRGLRGAEVELPHDIRDMIVDLPPWN